MTQKSVVLATGHMFVLDWSKNNIGEQQHQQQKLLVESVGQRAVDFARAKDGGKTTFMRYVKAFDQTEVALAAWSQKVRQDVDKGIELRAFGSVISRGCTDGTSDLDMCFVRAPPMGDSDASAPPPPPCVSGEASSSYSYSTIAKEFLDRTILSMEQVFANMGMTGLDAILGARVKILSHHLSPERASCAVSVSDTNHLTPLIAVLQEFVTAKVNCHCTLKRTDVSLELLFASTADAVSARDLLVGLGSWLQSRKQQGLLSEDQKIIRDLIQQDDDDDDDEPPKHDDESPKHKAIKWDWKGVPKDASEIPQMLELFDTDFDKEIFGFKAYGFRNTRLLRRYITSKSIAFVGAAFIKQWGKQSGVLDKKHRLNSYALDVLWICFLLRTNVLKHIMPSEISPYMDSGKFHAEIMSEKGYVDPFAGCGRGSHEEQQLQVQVGALLVEFFKFYANESFWDDKVVTLHNANGFESRDQHAKRTSCEWTPANEKPNDTTIGYYRMCIEDPFEKNLNVGRKVNFKGLSPILRKFKEMKNGIEDWNEVTPIIPQEKQKNGSEHSHPQVMIVEVHSAVDLVKVVTLLEAAKDGCLIQSLDGFPCIYLRNSGSVPCFSIGVQHWECIKLKLSKQDSGDAVAFKLVGGSKDAEAIRKYFASSKKQKGPNGEAVPEWTPVTRDGLREVPVQGAVATSDEAKTEEQ